ncbi:MAG TPA: efflux RND transporter permease subunit [Candidatus Brocadiia bacterium]|nr:efflux RND transporter permease subunit [Candidatus Brocadiales bacterium]
MVSKLIRYCLENRFVIIIFYCFILFAGYYCLNRMPIDAIPDIGENQSIVFTDWPGRSPTDVENQITYPLTRALQGVPGVKVIRSSSAFGFSMIYLIFKDDINFYWARSRILERLNLAQKWLPPGVIATLGPDATGLGQIFWYTIEGKGYDLAQLRSLQDWFVRYQLNAVEGVSEVAPIGGFVKQYQVDVDPNRMLAHDVKLSEVFNAVRSCNIDIGAKVIEKNMMEYIIRGVGFIKTIEDVENVVVAEKKGVPVYIKNIGKVTFGPEFRRGALDKAGQEVTGGVVIMRYGQNPRQITDRIQAKIKEIEPALPPGVKIVPFYQRKTLINATVATLKEALTEESILASVIVIIFLLNLQTSIVVCITLPLSIMISFIAMYFLKIEANIMSLSGIAIAIGELSDMGIIISENCFRHLQLYRKEKGIIETIYGACSEVGSAVIAANLTTVVSFFPVFALIGQEGKLFRPLAYTKSFALLASLIIALTLIPVLCTFLLRGKIPPPEKNITTRALQAFYRPRLHWILRHKAVFLSIVFTIMIGGFFTAAGAKIITRPFAKVVGLERELAMGKRSHSTIARALWKIEHTIPGMGKEFMPPLDEGSILFMPTMLPNTGITQAVETIGQQDLIIRTFPEVESVVGKVGRAETATDPAPIEMFETIIMLHPKETWLKRKIKKGFVTELTSDVVEWLGENKYIEKLPDDIESIGGDIEHNVSRDVNVFVRERLFEGTPQEQVNRELPGFITDKLAERLALTLNGDKLAKGNPNPSLRGDAVPETISREGIASPSARNDISNDENLPTIIRNAFLDTVTRKLPLVATTKQELIEEMNEELEIPGAANIWTQPIVNRIDMLATGIRTSVGVKVFGVDKDIETTIANIEKIEQQIEAILKRVPGSADLYAERISGKPYIEFIIKRDEIARYGVMLGDVQDVITTAVGGENLTWTVEGRERYPVRVRYLRELRDNVTALKRILVPTPTGAQIPLSQLVDIRMIPGPAMINSENGVLRGYVLLNVRGRDPVGFVNEASKIVEAEMKGKIPKGYFIQWSGQFENMVRARKTLMLLVPLSLFLNFMIIYMDFKRVSLCINVFLAIPITLSGGLWLLQIGGFNFSVAVWVGFIALFGIAVDDGILVTTYLRQLFAERQPKTIQEIRDVTVEAAMQRIRPMMMTTLNTIIGLMPVMWATGMGAEVAKPMAIPAIGGMTLEILTMGTVPCLYAFLEERRLRKKLKAESASGG